MLTLSSISLKREELRSSLGVPQAIVNTASALNSSQYIITEALQARLIII